MREVQTGGYWSSYFCDVHKNAKKKYKTNIPYRAEQLFDPESLSGLQDYNLLTIFYTNDIHCLPNICQKYSLFNMLHF
jgi:hypothetical protein